MDPMIITTEEHAPNPQDEAIQQLPNAPINDEDSIGIHVELVSSSSSSLLSIENDIRDSYQEKQSEKEKHLDELIEREKQKLAYQERLKALITETTLDEKPFIEIGSIEHRYNHYLCCGPLKITNQNKFRRLVIRVVDSYLFQFFIMATILLNCVMLALQDPTNPPDGSPGAIRNMIVNYSEYFFTSVFLLEFLLKCIAMGLVMHPNAYFRNLWNVIDFIIVIVSIISLFNVAGNFSIIRVVRVLKPLRAITNVKEIKLLIDSFTNFESIQLIFNSLILFSIFLLLLSLIGIQLFQGAMRQHCYHELTNAIFDPEQFCSLGTYPWGQECPDGYTCRVGNNTAWHGFFHWDNFLLGALTVFQIVTLEGWSELYYDIKEAMSPIMLPYFLVIVLFGGMFMVNLVLAIINNSYNQLKQKQGDEDDFFTNLQRKVSTFLSSIKLKKPTITNPFLLRLLGIHKKIVRLCHKLTNSKGFKFGITLLILFNTIILTLEFYGMPEEMRLVLDILNSILSIIFMLEAILLILAKGPIKYFKEINNTFDFIICIIGIAEMITFISQTKIVIGSALRAFRLIRLLRFISAWRSLRNIVLTIINSIRSIIMVTLLLVIFLFVMSLLAMQLFGGLWENPDRSHDFRTLFSSMIIIFQIICVDGWNDPMLTLMEVNPWYALYFVILFIVGVYFILSLFIIVLIQNVISDDKKTVLNKDKIRRKLLRNIKKILPWTNKQDIKQEKKVHSIAKTIEKDSKGLEDEVHFEQIVNAKEEDWSSEEDDPIQLKDLILRNPFESDCSFCILPDSRWSRVRRLSIKIVSHPIIEAILTILIIVGSILVMFDEPYMDPNRVFASILYHINNVFTVIFILECVFKSLAYGFVVHASSYLRRDHWNKLDFFVVCISILAFIDIESSSFRSLRVLRSLKSLRSLKTIRSVRALRPLRFLKRLNGIRQMVEVLILSVPNIINVTIVCIFIYAIMAILGVQLFAGKFYRCSDASIVTEVACLEANASWQNAELHFDNFLQASLTLFEVATLEGFQTVLYNTMDATNVGHAPVENHQWYMALYLVGFIIIGTFFISNLFVGVLIEKFIKIREMDSAMGMLSPLQRRWVHTQLKMFRTRVSDYPPAPKNVIRKSIFRVVTHRLFEFFIALVIVIFCVTQTLHHFQESEGYQLLFFITDILFNVIFTLEILLKMVAFSYKFFTYDLWNDLDLAIQLIALISFILKNTISADTGLSIISVIRVVRVFRLVMLIKHASSIKRLLRIVIISIPAIINVTGILFVALCIYALLGMKTLGRVRHLHYINKHANFETYPLSLFTMFRISTGENWNSLMHEYMSPIGCSRKLGNCLEYPILAVFFFCSFIVIGLYVLMNLFVAIALQNFKDVVEEINNDLSDDLITKYKRVWIKFDPKHQNHIPILSVIPFCVALGAPLGIRKNATNEDITDFLAKLHVSSDSGLITKEKLLFSLAGHCYSQHISSGLLNLLNQEIPDRIQLIGQEKENEKQAEQPIQENMYDRLFNLDFAEKMKNHKPMYCASTLGAVLTNIACQGNPNQIAQRHKAHVQMRLFESITQAIAQPSFLDLDKVPSIIDSPPPSIIDSPPLTSSFQGSSSSEEDDTLS